MSLIILYAHHPVLSAFFDDRRKTRRIPVTLLDLGFSAVTVPLASLAAGLGLGICFPRPLSGAEGADVGSRGGGRFEPGGVELNAASAAAGALRLVGVDADVVLSLGPAIVVVCDVVFCPLSRRAFPIMP